MSLVNPAPDPAPLPASGKNLPPTPWSFVCKARSSWEHLGHLLQYYRTPLEHYAVAHHRLSHEDAQDAVANLISSFLHRQGPLDSLAEGSGKFRTWMLAALNHTVIEQYRRATSQKRGGGTANIPLDDAPEPVSGTPDPAAAFDNAVARSLMDTVTQRFMTEATADAEELLIRKHLLEEESATVASQAAAFGLSAATIKRRRADARVRFKEILHEEASGLVQDPSLLSQELHHLRNALRRE